jgi:hypothetical protein
MSEYVQIPTKVARLIAQLLPDTAQISVEDEYPTIKAIESFRALLPREGTDLPPPTRGPFRVGRHAGCVVADHPVPNVGGSDDVEYYGGHMIAESIARQNAPMLAASWDLYEALEMVRDADEDCKKDGLPTIPREARAKIDAALAKAEGRS